MSMLLLVLGIMTSSSPSVAGDEASRSLSRDEAPGSLSRDEASSSLSVAIVGDTPKARALAIELGHVVLEQGVVDEHLALLRDAGPCDDEECFAKLAVLAEVDRVLSVKEVEGALDVLCVDSTPRSIRKRVVDAASLARAIAFEEEPTPPPLPAAPAADAPAAAAPPVATTRGAPAARPLPLLGAGVAGAGALAVVAGGVFGALALQSMASAESAHFQSDAIAFANEANERLWWSGGLAGTGALVTALGASLLVMGDAS